MRFIFSPNFINVFVFCLLTNCQCQDVLKFVLNMTWCKAVWVIHIFTLGVGSAWSETQQSSMLSSAEGSDEMRLWRKHEWFKAWNMNAGWTLLWDRVQTLTHLEWNRNFVTPQSCTHQSSTVRGFNHEFIFSFISTIERPFYHTTNKTDFKVLNSVTSFIPVFFFVIDRLKEFTVGYFSWF